MAELLLEPVDVEEDSLQRVAVDTFRFKKDVSPPPTAPWTACVPSSWSHTLLG